MQEYVVGFLHDEQRVVLIWKNRPQWQAGHLNGVGGHVEKFDVQHHDAMAREFYEETGVKTHPRQWSHFLSLMGKNADVHCFAMFDHEGLISKVMTKTDERIQVIRFSNINVGPFKTVPNLRWIIPLMLQRDHYHPIYVNFYGED